MMISLKIGPIIFVGNVLLIVKFYEAHTNAYLLEIVIKPFLCSTPKIFVIIFQNNPHEG